jgi:cell division protease FtsH
MVFEWGMSDLGFIAFAQGSDVLCSAETMAKAEARVQAISDREYASTREILLAHRSALDAVANGLLERETLSGDEVTRICSGAPRAEKKATTAPLPATSSTRPPREVGSTTAPAPDLSGLPNLAPAFQQKG